MYGRPARRARSPVPACRFIDSDQQVAEFAALHWRVDLLQSRFQILLRFTRQAFATFLQARPAIFRSTRPQRIAPRHNKTGGRRYANRLIKSSAKRLAKQKVPIKYRSQPPVADQTCRPQKRSVSPCEPMAATREGILVTERRLSRRFTPSRMTSLPTDFLQFIKPLRRPRARHQNAADSPLERGRPSG
jgi:hypothetical protein